LPAPIIPISTIDLPTPITLEYLTNTWLQPGAVCSEAEKPFKRLSMDGTSVTALKRVVNETLPRELAFHGIALQFAHA
jgi:hypothetical protein